MSGTVERALVGLLRAGRALLPADRRDWVEAVCAEAADVPDGSQRLRWLAGGLWMAVAEARAARAIAGVLGGLGLGSVVVWLDWHEGSRNPAVPVNRVGTIAIVLIVALLPVVTRRWLGPVAGNRPARVLRVVGYLLVYALLFVMAGLSRFAGSRFDDFHAFDQANWEADMREGAVVGLVLIVALVSGYAFAVLAVTSHRTAVAPSTLSLGAGLGALAALALYALMPLGNSLHPHAPWLAVPYHIAVVAAVAAAVVAAPLIAGLLASRRAGAPGPGGVAGLCAGVTVALLLAILTVTTMLVFPGQVDLRWANPDPSVAHGTPFEIRMSVGDAAIKYQFGLLFGPLAGWVLGLIGAGHAEPAAPRGAATVQAGS